MKREYLKLPAHTEYSMGARLFGRFYSAVILAAIPEYPVLVVAEIPNYHYVGDGEIELNGMTPIEWAETVVREYRSFAGKDARCSAWADPETQYDPDVRRRSKLYLKVNLKRGPELRTSTLREYFQDNRVFLMPWLKTLPYEIGRAKWPDEAAKSYQVRATDHDYTLSALEQAISRRPKGKSVATRKASTFLERLRQERNFSARKVDPHLGRM
jgi:hypothetical protein